MNIDVSRYLGSVSRVVESREKDGKPARVARLIKTYSTDAADLWDAITSPERLARWFMPVTGDLKIGGRFQFEGNAGGTVLTCEQPKRIEVTWEFGGEVSWVELLLKDAGGGRTELVLDHTAFVDKERWDTYGPGAVGLGWDLSFLGLELFIESGGQAVNPEQIAGWTMSEEGVRLISGASLLWRDASVADGTDPETANAAATRTTSFYTGVSEDAPAQS